MHDDLPSSDEKRPWFEPLVAILMGVTTLTTAWCSYHSSRWSGHGSGLAGHVDALQRQAFAMHLESQQIETVHTRIFMGLVDAQLAGNEKVVKFYRDRIGGEFKPAYEKWLALRPFDDPAAPPHPFMPGLYRPRFEDEIRDARAEAARDAARSNEADEQASNYLRLTVLLAIVLFISGTARTFDRRVVRQSCLAFAITLLVYAVIRLVMLPVI